LVGIFIVSVAKLPGSEVMFKGGFGVSPTAALTILALMIPTALFFSCILVAVSSYAKNSREAQTYLTSVSFVVLIPAVFSQFIGLTDYGSSLWVNFIPILNTANNVRLALLGKAMLVPVLCSVAVSLVLAAIGFVVTVRMFNREEVLVRV
jgi:sodium transport system permease protein